MCVCVCVCVCVKRSTIFFTLFVSKNTLPPLPIWKLWTVPNKTILIAHRIYSSHLDQRKLLRQTNLQFDLLKLLNFRPITLLCTGLQLKSTHFSSGFEEYESTKHYMITKYKCSSLVFNHCVSGHMECLKGRNSSQL